MAVLVYIENVEGTIKKSGAEAAYYASQAGALLNSDAVGLVIGKVQNMDGVTHLGLSKIMHINAGSEASMDSQSESKVIADIAKEIGANMVILSHTTNGKAITGRLGIRLDAGIVSGANALPNVDNGVMVTKTVYSGKAIAHVKINTKVSVISVMGNAIKPVTSDTTTPVEQRSLDVPTAKVTVVERKTAKGSVPLPEAELVVSAGRGMKGPENWGIIEDLAAALGATTACSRPVADADWRPHHEHVGQTGVAIRPNLYIAIGISGAIQHLAGVNNSKVIVVINKDPEAPFFKAADYGVVGDLFEVVPRLTAAVNQLKGH